eukprot:scaffold18572_cov33-Phaeocystis_antarctica.AAC.3
MDTGPMCGLQRQRAESLGLQGRSSSPYTVPLCLGCEGPASRNPCEHREERDAARVDVDRHAVAARAGYGSGLDSGSSLGEDDRIIGLGF